MIQFTIRPSWTDEATATSYQNVIFGESKIVQSKYRDADLLGDKAPFAFSTLKATEA